MAHYFVERESPKFQKFQVFEHFVEQKMYYIDKI